MKLTTPPPVEDLDPQYSEQLRARLVADARRSRRRRSVWTPALAAACGVAVITGGVIVSTRSGSDFPAPAGSPPTSSAPEVRKVPPGDSARVSLDLGPAARVDSVAAARQCLAEKTSALGEPNTAKPSDADTATVHVARWLKTLPGDNGVLQPPRDRQLAQTFTTKGGVRVQCVDSRLLQVFDPVFAGVSWERSRNLDPTEPVNGRWAIFEVPSGGSSLLFVSFTFSTLPNIARVEARIRWTGGASPWYGVPVADGAGYLTASQQGAIHQPRAMEVDYRAFDSNGRQVFADIEYG